jgi:hypothetical protein
MSKKELVYVVMPKEFPKVMTKYLESLKNDNDFIDSYHVNAHDRRIIINFKEHATDEYITEKLKSNTLQTKEDLINKGFFHNYVKVVRDALRDEVVDIDNMTINIPMYATEYKNEDQIENNIEPMRVIINY